MHVNTMRRSGRLVRIIELNQNIEPANGSTITKGGTSTTMPKRTVAPFTRDQILEHDTQWADLLQQIRDALRQHARATQQGHVESIARIEVELLTLGEMVKYSERRWEQRGAWMRYYQVTGGSIHTNLGCRSFNKHTVYVVRTDLSGLDLEDVAAHHKMCRHCPSVGVGQDVLDRAYRKYRLI